jgi:cystathionine beta-lyase
MSDAPAWRPSTRLIHAGETPDALSRTVGPAVQRGSTVLLPSAAALYDESRPTYGRGGLETHQALMSALAELENATTVRLYPSGLAAITGAMLAVLSAGDDILVSDGAYKPTRRFCDHVLRRFGVQTRYYDPAISPQDLLAMALPATRLIVMESPSSLTFEVQDVPAIAALAKARGILTLVDNTWAAGVLFKPLDHGVDISAQALTKYVGGHSDVFMGSAASRDPAVGRALDQSIWDFGWAVSPDDAYQMLRGLRTLPVRLERHGASALAIARWLSDHPAVARVLHPALPDSPGHAAWARDYAGAAGVFGVVLKTADIAKTHAFLDALRLFGLGFSWGGFESLALNADPQLTVRRHPPRFDGALIRLNIGLEDTADLIADLDQALALAG